VFGVPALDSVAGPALRALIEADWVASLTLPVTTRSDAAGACDGVKNGLYAFHTGGDPNPWWQVDLGQVRPLGRVVVYNRLDYAPGLHNADTLRILASDDGRTWRLVHDQKGEHFGGIHGAKPLTVAFADGVLSSRFVRLTIPSAAPIFLHLDEVEVYGPEAGGPNLALHQPADQSSLSPWSTAKIHERAEFPAAEVVARGRRLLTELARAGVPTQAWRDRFDAVEERVKALSAEASEEQRRELYFAARWAVRGLIFANPLLDFQRLLFVKRFTQETYPDVCLNHMPWVSRPGGDLCILAPAEGQRSLFAALAEPSTEANAPPVASLRRLLNGALGPGHVHGLDLWFDGDRIVLGYAKAKSDQPPAGWLDRCSNYELRRNEEPTHLFEVGVDGTGLRQITNGEWSDLDPTYVPSGDIVFVSERCGTSLQCNEYDKDETSCNLYVVGPDGSGIRRLSVNKDGDYLPHCLDNGLVGYTRWEYHERSFAFIQSLWVIRPDGTGGDALFKQHFANPWALEDVRSIPGSRKLVAIATGHHTLAVGPLVIIDPLQGINEPRGMGIVTPGVKPPEGGMDGVVVPEGGVADASGFYSTPWPLSEKFFLVAYSSSQATTEPAGYGLYVVDVFGNKELIYRDPAISSFVPIPLRPRPHPPVVADTTDLTCNEATCMLADAVSGVDGIERSRIRYLRVAEPIGWPYDNSSGGRRYVEDHWCLAPTGEPQLVLNWTPVRVLGDTPIEPDGSAHFRVPADTAVYFQLLDENRMELRRMRSFISFQPGEKRSCVGCHETRDRASLPGPPPLALQRPAAELLAPPWGRRPLSFLRDVQPVFDRHCSGCHGGLKPAGGLDFCAGLTSYDRSVPGYGYNRAYTSLLSAGLVSCSPARQQDASITPPLAYGAHRSKLIAVLNSSAHAERVQLSDEDLLRLTIWIDANAPYHDGFVDKRPSQPAYDIAADQELHRRFLAVHERRCTACHPPEAVSRLDWIDLGEPARSRFLAAPLAAETGATPRCDQTVYASGDDPDYRALSALVTEAVTRQWRQPRRDLLALEPPNH
jgi:mono/diheme cytochrome c family protein